MSPTMIAGYLALFSAVGFGFLFVNLLVGRFVRPDEPGIEKGEVYECGEPTIGSSFVQFDLRFYVIALLFIIFDVEVAFFFPWATVFGKATHLMDPNLATVSTEYQPTEPVTTIYNDLGVPGMTEPSPGFDAIGDPQAISDTAGLLALVSMGDIAVFFAVLMVGFAYVWCRGDLEWVRAVSQERARSGEATTSDSGSPESGAAREPALTV